MPVAEAIIGEPAAVAVVLPATLPFVLPLALPGAVYGSVTAAAANDVSSARASDASMPCGVSKAACKSWLARLEPASDRLLQAAASAEATLSCAAYVGTKEGGWG